MPGTIAWMKFATRRKSTHHASGELEGVVRLGKRTKALTGRIQPGEIVIIDHADLDRVAAEGLVEKQVKAVINASKFSTGRYPNLGALVLCGAGISLIEGVGADIFNRIRDGDVLKLEDGTVMRDGNVVAEGEVVDMEAAQRTLDLSKKNISSALESFAENTLQYMINERDFILEAIRLPEIKTQFAGRHVLMVVRGYGYKEDLASLRGYIHDFRPILIGVDGGADALLEQKLTPHVIIGDFDSVSTKALSCGAELIVAVGARASMVEFMDKGRKGMASTFLVRLRVGPKLVDAKGVSELHRSEPRRWELFGLVGAALVTMLVVIGISQPMRLVLQ
ncbi:MAG TPA: putative cytokinetic ring protein SteA, partial [Actinomycetota bacterium]|nr:putative cytokinetic ring protein SteA [Actinomycetota bacterium]